MSRREVDLGRLLQKVGRLIEDEGQKASQKFYEWQRVERLERDSIRGGGNGGAAFDDRRREMAGDRHTSALRGRWLRVQVQLAGAAAEAEVLLKEARVEDSKLDKHRTPAQVEADGWCGNHWARAGVLEPVALRPSGEPYYRGRCRFCGAWPGGDPPADVLKDRGSGRQVQVKVQ